MTEPCSFTLSGLEQGPEQKVSEVFSSLVFGMPVPDQIRLRCPFFIAELDLRISGSLRCTRGM